MRQIMPLLNIIEINRCISLIWYEKFVYTWSTVSLQIYRYCVNNLFRIHIGGCSTTAYRHTHVWSQTSYSDLHPPLSLLSFQHSLFIQLVWVFLFICLFSLYFFFFSFWCVLLYMLYEHVNVTVEDLRKSVYYSNTCLAEFCSCFEFSFNEQ